MAKATIEALRDSESATKRGLQLGIHHPGGDADDELVADLQLPGTAVTQVIDKLLGARRHYDGFTQIARRMDPGILTQRQGDGDRTMKLIDDEGTVTGNYFKSWKENFKQGTGLGLLYLAFGALLALALVFYNRMDQSDIKIMWAVVIAIGIFYFISLCWVFAIQSKFVHTVQDTIHYSFVIAFQNLPETFLIMITIAAVVFFS